MVKFPSLKEVASGLDSQKMYINIYIVFKFKLKPKTLYIIVKNIWNNKYQSYSSNAAWAWIAADGVGFG